MVQGREGAAGCLGFAAGSVALLWRLRNQHLAHALRGGLVRALSSDGASQPPTNGALGEINKQNKEKGVKNDSVSRLASVEPDSRALEENLGHGSCIPTSYLQNIPAKEARIVRFILDYFEWRSLPIDGLLINGGYVRDLLLRGVPDDLDISVCLQECLPHVTVQWLLSDLTVFNDTLQHEVREERYGFESFTSVDIQGDVSKNKQLDTAKAVFKFSGGAASIEVDLMPTIGEETYADDGNRVPTREQRGSPKQDALRRDLTIGSMLIKVAKRSDACETDYDCEDGQRGLSWTLLDYYNGLGDLHQGLLRAPWPDEIPPGAIDTLFSAQDRRLADAVGLDLGSAQQVWWVKVLRDDPVRILRTFRFAAKLDFAICPSFWKVLCFCLAELKQKVAGSRKMTEILKLAKYGLPKVENFFSLCFRKRFVFQSDGRQTCLAPAVFGGLDSDRIAHFVPFVESFDKVPFLGIYEQAMQDCLSREQLGSDVVVGCFLAVAIFSAKMPPYPEWKHEDPSNVEDGLLPFEKCFERACNGLCTSNELRDAGSKLLRSFAELVPLLDTEPSPLDALFGKRLHLSRDPHVQSLLAGSGSASAEKLFAQYLRVWEVLRLQSKLNSYSHEIIISMLGFAHMRPSAGQGDGLALLTEQQAAHTRETAHSILKGLQGATIPKMTGRGVSQMPQIVPHLRGDVIKRLHVLWRMLSPAHPRDLDSLEELALFLNQDCQGLLEDMTKEWYEDEEHTKLRPAYQRKTGPKKKRNKSPAKPRS